MTPRLDFYLSKIAKVLLLSSVVVLLTQCGVRHSDTQTAVVLVEPPIKAKGGGNGSGYEGLPILGYTCKDAAKSITAVTTMVKASAGVSEITVYNDFIKTNYSVDVTRSVSSGVTSFIGQNLQITINRIQINGTATGRLRFSTPTQTYQVDVDCDLQFQN